MYRFHWTDFLLNTLSFNSCMFGSSFYAYQWGITDSTARNWFKFWNKVWLSPSWLSRHSFFLHISL